MNLSLRFSLGLAAVVFAAGCAAESGDADAGDPAGSTAEGALKIAAPRTTEVRSAYGSRAGQPITWTVDSTGLDVLANRAGAITRGSDPTLDALDTRGEGAPRTGEDPALDVLREPLRVSGRPGEFAQATKKVPR